MKMKKGETNEKFKTIYEGNDKEYLINDLLIKNMKSEFVFYMKI